MGWKGAVRSIAAAQRRAEREAKRRQRELEKQQQRLEKMEEMERAAYEVEVYDNYIERIQSVHKECADQWNWDTVKSTPPSKPERSDFYEHEEAAKTELAQFKPSILDKVLGRTDAKRASLTEAIEEAKKSDQQEYELATTNYNQEYENWEILCKVADKVLVGDPTGYLEAIEQANPFDEIEELGSGLKIGAESNQPIEASIYVHSEEVIPTEAKTLLKSGKVSIKKMPKTKFYEIYQDYVCSCVLRVARELYALLPVDMVIINAVGNILNTKTGYEEEHPILSVAIPRETLMKLNFDQIDPSDSMGNFVHKMKFRKTKGFDAVEAIKPADFQSDV